MSNWREETLGKGAAAWMSGATGWPIFSNMGTTPLSLTSSG
jgi:hypothetical protein